MFQRHLATLATFALLLACQRTTPSPEPSRVATAPSSANPPPAPSPSLAPGASTALADVDAGAPAEPLGPPGATISLVPDGGDASPPTYRLLLTEAGKTTTFTFYVPCSQVKPVYRHVDVDGDGRADTVFFFPRSTAAELDYDRLPAGTVVLTPPPGRPGGSLDYDLAATILSVGAGNLDEVVARAKAIPNKGVTSAAACALIAQARTTAGFRAVATPDARIVVFRQPGDLALSSRLVPLADLDKPEADGGATPSVTRILGGLGREGCKKNLGYTPEGGCEKGRPVCAWGQAAGDAWVFAWTPSGQMRLQAVTFWDM